MGGRGLPSRGATRGWNILQSHQSLDVEHSKRRFYLDPVSLPPILSKTHVCPLVDVIAVSLFLQILRRKTVRAFFGPMSLKVCQSSLEPPTSPCRSEASGEFKEKDESLGSETGKPDTTRRVTDITVSTPEIASNGVLEIWMTDVGHNVFDLLPFSFRMVGPMGQRVEIVT